MSKLTYTIVTKKIKDKKEVVIESAGHTSRFTILDIEANIAKGEKALKEFEGNAKIHKDIMTNIEAHHPFVSKMSDKELHTIHMYFDAKAHYNTYSDKAKQMKKAIKEEQADLKEVLEQLPELNG